MFLKHSLINSLSEKNIGDDFHQTSYIFYIHILSHHRRRYALLPTDSNTYVVHIMVHQIECLFLYDCSYKYYHTRYWVPVLIVLSLNATHTSTHTYIHTCTQTHIHAPVDLLYDTNDTYACIISIKH